MSRGNVKVTPLPEGVTMIDGVERNRLHPKTFHIPTFAEKFMVEAGKYVKVGLESPDGNGEKFWLLVTRRAGDKMVGEVSNDLVRTHQHGIICGDRLQFQPQHILSIMD